MKTLFSPAINITVAILLSSVFFIAGQNVVQTFAVADMVAISYLQPQPPDYLLGLGIHQTVPDKNKVHCYVDYYEHMLKVFPDVWDVYGMLGYCYHYLNDDTKAIRYFKTAIEHYPNYFWDYYDLAVIYIHESRYKEASALLLNALNIPLLTSFKRMFMSPIYLSLLGTDQKAAVAYTAKHLEEKYRSSSVLLQILNQTGNDTGAQEALKKSDPELYAF